MGWNLSWIKPRGLDGGVRGVQQIYRRVRGFGFRVRDSLGALGGYLTWAEYREVMYRGGGCYATWFEDGKGVDGEDFSYEKGMMVPFKKYWQKDFPTLWALPAWFFFLGMSTARNSSIWAPQAIFRKQHLCYIVSLPVTVHYVLVRHLS